MEIGLYKFVVNKSGNQSLIYSLLRFYMISKRINSFKLLTEYKYLRIIYKNSKIEWVNKNMFEENVYLLWQESGVRS